MMNDENITQTYLIEKDMIRVRDLNTINFGIKNLCLEHTIEVLNTIPFINK